MTNYCRDLPEGLERKWSSVAEMFTGLGILSADAADKTTALPPPDTFGASSAFAYMVEVRPGEKRGFNISLWNDLDARSCFFKWAGYDETAINGKIQEIREANPGNEDAAVDTWFSTQSSLIQNVYAVVSMMNDFQKPLASGGVNRNDPDNPTDKGDPNVVTDFEIQEYARDVVGNDTSPEYDKTAQRLIRGLNSAMGLLTFLTTQPPETASRPEVPIAIGQDDNAAAPKDAWSRWWDDNKVYVFAAGAGLAFGGLLWLSRSLGIQKGRSLERAKSVRRPEDVNTLVVRTREPNPLAASANGSRGGAPKKPNSADIRAKVVESLPAPLRAPEAKAELSDFTPLVDSMVSEIEKNPKLSAKVLPELAFDALHRRFAAWATESSLSEDQQKLWKGYAAEMKDNHFALGLEEALPKEGTAGTK